MNWRKEIIECLSAPVPEGQLKGAYRSILQFAFGKYYISGGKYRRAGLGETEVPARAVERMIDKGDLRISGNPINCEDLHTFELTSPPALKKPKLVKRKKERIDALSLSL